MQLLFVSKGTNGGTVYPQIPSTFTSGGGGAMMPTPPTGGTIPHYIPSCDYNLLNLKKRRRKLYNKVANGEQNGLGEISNGTTKEADQDDDEEEYEDDDGGDDDEDNDEIFHHHANLQFHPTLGDKMINRRGDDSNEDEEDDDDDDDDEEEEEDEDEDDEDEDEDSEDDEEEENDGLMFEQTGGQHGWMPLRDRKIFQGCVVGQPFNGSNMGAGVTGMTGVGSLLNKVGAAGAIRKWKFPVDEKCITRSLSAHT